MPNNIIFESQLALLVKESGINIDSKVLREQLENAWKGDNTKEKVGFFTNYGAIFKDILKKWNAKEIKNGILTGANVNFKKHLLTVEKHLKLCAMAVIPELRSSRHYLSSITFGGEVLPNTIYAGFKFDADQFATNNKAIQDMVGEQREIAYQKLKGGFENKLTREITNLVYQKDKVSKLTQQEKIQNLLALDAHRKALGPAKLTEQEAVIYQDAIDEWKVVLGQDKLSTVENAVANIYRQMATNIASEENIRNQVTGSIQEYNKDIAPAAVEIENYQTLELVAIQQKKDELKAHRQQVRENLGVQDADAEALGEFFEGVDPQPREEENPADEKTNEFTFNRVAYFNKKYDLRIIDVTFLKNVEKVSKILQEAVEEKEKLTREDSVVVIEKGVAKAYKASGYYKKQIAEELKEKEEIIKEAEEKLFKDVQELRTKQDAQKKVLEGEAYKNFKEALDKTIESKQKEFEKLKLDTEKEYEDNLKAYKGGICIIKNEGKEQRIKSSEYYETHETPKEKEGYAALEQMYESCFKKACINAKNMAYKDAKEVDFSVIAKDTDMLFKTAMFNCGLFDNTKYNDVILKGSFGGISTEKLAEIAHNAPAGPWGLKQSSDEAWKLQSQSAVDIINHWKRPNRELTMHEQIQKDLSLATSKFSQNKISRKQLLDYTIAAESHFQQTYKDRSRRIFSPIKYRLEKYAIAKCKMALGIGQKDSLRAHMAKIYNDQAQKVNKGIIAKDIDKLLSNSYNPNKEREFLAKEHQILRDKEIAQELQRQENLRKADREPMSIKELDERNVLLGKGPKSQPVVPQRVAQHGLVQG